MSEEKFLGTRFDGSDYDPGKDDVRLSGQLNDIYNLCKDGRWRTLEEISAQTGHPHASVSAQLRHLRKDRFGSHYVDKRHLSDGLWEYRLDVHYGENREPVLPEASRNSDFQRRFDGAKKYLAKYLFNRPDLPSEHDWDRNLRTLIEKERMTFTHLFDYFQFLFHLKDRRKIEKISSQTLLSHVQEWRVSRDEAESSPPNAPSAPSCFYSQLHIKGSMFRWCDPETMKEYELPCPYCRKDDYEEAKRKLITELNRS